MYLSTLSRAPLFLCALIRSKVGDALMAINNISVKDMSFAEIMQRMKFSLREAPHVLLRFRTMEERYRLLRMKVGPSTGGPAARQSSRCRRTEVVDARIRVGSFCCG